MRKASFLILLTMLCARTAAADTIIIMDDNNNIKQQVYTLPNTAVQTTPAVQTVVQPQPIYVTGGAFTAAAGYCYTSGSASCGSQRNTCSAQLLLRFSGNCSSGRFYRSTGRQRYLRRRASSPPSPSSKINLKRL